MKAIQSCEGRDWRPALCALVSCALLGCGDETQQCHVSAASNAAPVDGSLRYNASVSGTASISSLVYAGANGAVTVQNPSLPFELGIDALAGMTMSITVDGKAESGGNVYAGYTFSDPLGADPLVVSASCR